MDKKIILVLFLIIVLGALIRCAPLVLQSYGEPDAYFHIRMAELVKQEKAIPSFDELSMQGRAYSYAPIYHLFYALFSILSFLPVSLLVRIFPQIFGIIGIIVVFIFSKKIFGSNKIALLSAFMLATMTYHLFRTSAEPRPDGLALLIVPFIIFLLYSKHYKSAVFLSVFQVLLHPLSTLFLLLFLVVWSVCFKVRRKGIDAKLFLALILVVTAVFAIWLLHLPYPISNYVSNVSLESGEMQKPLMLEFFSLFSICWPFLLFGLVKMKNQFFLLLFFVFSFFYSMFGVRLGFFVSFPAAMIAGFGLAFIIEKIRPYEKIFFMMFLVLCIIAIYPFSQFGGALLSKGEQSSMVWLSKNAEKDANIMSLWDRGHPLTYYAERKVVIDGYFEFAPDLSKRNNAMKELIATADCNNIYTQIHKFNINYFYIFSGALKSLEFGNGIMESYECEIERGVFENDKSKIIGYDLETKPKEAEEKITNT